jgi:stearoyl-CoA desaturase (delta-9 desaturase)
VTTRASEATSDTDRPSNPSVAPAAREPVRVIARKPRSVGQLIGFWGTVAINVFAVWAFIRGGITAKLVIVALLSFWIRMFGITGVYHRYFSHKTYRTSRAFQLILAFLGTTATQKGPLWWAGTHRHHHRYSDQENDVHSPMRRGFWYSHMGWWLGREHEDYDPKVIQDFYAYPELRWLDKWHIVGPVALMAACFAIGGVDGLLWGYVVPTCVLAHATFTINSLSHVWGSRRFATTDTSRNNPWLALLTMGEGWHNNHHHYQASARQGFYWWEIDISFYIIKAFEKVGLVWDVRGVPEHVLERNLLAKVGERSPLLLAKAGQKDVAPANDEDEGPALGQPALMDAE